MGTPRKSAGPGKGKKPTPKAGKTPAKKSTERGAAGAKRAAGPTPALRSNDPSGRGGKVPQGASNAPEAGSIPAARSKNATQEARVGGRSGAGKAAAAAPAAESAEGARGAVASLLSKQPAPETSDLSPTEDAFLTEYLRNGMNGTAAWLAVNPDCTPRAASVTAVRVLARANVRKKVEEYRALIAEQFALTREQVVAELTAVALADPNEIVQLRRVACPFCWGNDPQEILLKNKAAKAAGGEATPMTLGRLADPDPDCETCDGEGVEHMHLADTRKLSPAARRLYAGLKVTQGGGIQVVMHDRVAALTTLAKIHGAFEIDNKQKALPMAMAMAALVGQLHQGNAARLPIVKRLPQQPATLPAPAAGGLPMRSPTAKG